MNGILGNVLPKEEHPRATSVWDAQYGGKGQSCWLGCELVAAWPRPLPECMKALSVPFSVFSVSHVCTHILAVAGAPKPSRCLSTDGQ